MSSLSPARSAALACLMEAREGDLYVRDVLDSSPRMQGLDPRDAGLARRLALGVTATAGCLDELLDRFLAKPGKVSTRVRMALRISTFELLYLGIAPEVAVSQGVELVRSVAKAAAGLANAVLRRVAEEGGAYLAAADVPQDGRASVALARSAGLPVWLAREVEGSLGPEGARALCACELEPAPLAVHWNAFREGGDLREAGEDACPLPGCSLPADAAAFVSSGALERADAVSSDLHAQLVATAATRPGPCLEVGAGRGTKTFVMACQARRAGIAREHVALDLSERRCRLNAERLGRAGIGGVRVVSGDGRDLDAALLDLDAVAGERLLFDTVLVDVPCTGTGTMRRHPEIPWRLAPEDARSSLPGLQLELLCAAAGRVGPGGELLYATCSVLRQEGAGVIEKFLASPAGAGFETAPVTRAWIFGEPAFEPATTILRPAETPEGFVQLAPSPDGFDGHFCARLVRRA